MKFETVPQENQHDTSEQVVEGSVLQERLAHDEGQVTEEVEKVQQLSEQAKRATEERLENVRERLDEIPETQESQSGQVSNVENNKTHQEALQLQLQEGVAVGRGYIAPDKVSDVAALLTGNKDYLKSLLSQNFVDSIEKNDSLKSTHEAKNGMEKALVTEGSQSWFDRVLRSPGTEMPEGTMTPEKLENYLVAQASSWDRQGAFQYKDGKVRSLSTAIGPTFSADLSKKLTVAGVGGAAAAGIWAALTLPLAVSGVAIPVGAAIVGGGLAVQALRRNNMRKAIKAYVEDLAVKVTGISDKKLAREALNDAATKLDSVDPEAQATVNQLRDEVQKASGPLKQQLLRQLGEAEKAMAQSSLIQSGAVYNAEQFNGRVAEVAGEIADLPEVKTVDDQLGDRVAEVVAASNQGLAEAQKTRGQAEKEAA